MGSSEGREVDGWGESIPGVVWEVKEGSPYQVGRSADDAAAAAGAIEQRGKVSRKPLGAKLRRVCVRSIAVEQRRHVWWKR